MSGNAPASEPSVEDLESYRLRARAWIEINLEPRSSPVGHRGIEHFTPEVVAENRRRQRALFDAGYAGINWPTEVGGQGLTAAHEAIFAEEAQAFELPDFGALTNTTFHVCGPMIVAHASSEFARDLGPKILAGEALICQYFSEGSSGSDLAGVKMRASRDGGSWVLRGRKIWSTFAQIADWGLCLARTSWDKPKHEGLTWFAVRSDSPGLTTAGIRQIDGNEDYCEEVFDDVHVPDAQRLGAVNDGWSVTQLMLTLERGAWRAPKTSKALPAAPLAPSLVELARRTGSIADPVVQQKIARAHVLDYVTRSLLLRMAEVGGMSSGGAAMASYGKLFRGTYGPVIAALGMEIGGVAALDAGSDDAAFHRARVEFLNGRLYSIAGGTNEMQRNSISERILGMPREARVDTGVSFRSLVEQELQ